MAVTHVTAKRVPIQIGWIDNANICQFFGTSVIDETEFEPEHLPKYASFIDIRTLCHLSDTNFISPDLEGAFTLLGGL